MPTDHDQREDHPDSVRDLLSGERLRRLIREEPGLWPVVMTVMGVDGERRRNGRFGGLLWVATGFWGVVALASVVVVRWLSS